MDIKKIAPDINDYIKEDLPYIKPGENAHVGLSVPEIMFKYGSVQSKLRSMPNVGKYLLGAIKQVRKSYRELYDQPAAPVSQITAKDLQDLRALASELGVNEIGFTEVYPSYIFSNKKIIFSQAIVLLMQMQHDIISTAPSKQAEKEIIRTYLKLNVAANVLKEFLNNRNYRAAAGPALGGEVNYPLLAQKAGMGVIGKSGLLITPQFGPSIRLAVVYTDIENLPLNDDNGHLWVQEFCNSCKRCVEKCPVHAIYERAKVFADGSKQCIDYKKCAVPFSKNRGCTVCVKECTFFKGDYFKIKAAFLKKR